MCNVQARISINTPSEYFQFQKSTYFPKDFNKGFIVIEQDG